MTSVIHNPYLESLKKALHREASQVGFLAIDDVDRVFASAEAAQPLTILDAKAEAKALADRAGIDLGDDRDVFVDDMARTLTRFVALATNVKDCSAALTRFTEYFAKNYPGPDTVIYNPYCHAPKIFRAAINALAAQGQGTNDWSAEEKLTAEEAWQTLCETPDVTSPEEYPDHALITFEQLRSYMERAAPVSEEKTGSETCPMCLKAFKHGDVLRPRPNAPGPVHAACLENNPDIDRETGKIIVETLPTFLYGEPAPAPAVRGATS